MSEPSQKNNRASTLLTLFFTFLKIGAFTFGGGYAMIPLIQREVVESKHWLTDDDILSIIAISESTPGPIAINMATFVGYRTAGVLGSLMATLGVVLPSFVIILLVTGVLEQFYHLKAVTYAFQGIRAGVLALILKALWSMYRQSPHNVMSYILMALAFVAVAFFGVSALPVIIVCAVVGLTVSLTKARRDTK